MYKVILIWSFLAISFASLGQNTILSVFANGVTDCTQTIDSNSAKKTIQEQLTSYRSNGYFAASASYIITENDTIHCIIDVGEKYTHLLVTKHNLGEGYLPKNDSIVLTISEFNNMQDKLLTSFENQGFPFAKLLLEKPKIKRDTLCADLLFFPYLQFVYDTLVYRGTSEISKKYIAKYLNIEQGALYSEEVVREIDKKLRNLPLVKLNGPSHIVFYRGLVRVILNINDRVTDRVDGVIGLAPNSTNGSENSLLVTGEVHIELNNLLKSAKKLNLHWQNYLQRSQNLDVGFTYPYLFNTKLGVNGELNINKFDTLFVNLKSKFSFRYQKKGNNYIQFYYQNISSNLITVDTVSVRNQKKIPNNNPYKIDNYGLSLYQQDFDYLPNPRKGFKVLADLAIGQKTVLQNTLISQVKFINENTGQFINVYDTIDKKSLRLEFAASIDHFIPIKKQSTIRQAVVIKALHSPQYFFNELYNFGGFATLRGFDENELFASKYLSYTLEYRYLLSENSNIGLFANTAIIENKLESVASIYDIPYGFGAVANIQVGKGILNMAYALGTQQRNGLQLNSAKFHFGLINYF